MEVLRWGECLFDRGMRFMEGQVDAMSVVEREAGEGYIVSWGDWSGESWRAQWS